MVFLGRVVGIFCFRVEDFFFFKFLAGGMVVAVVWFCFGGCLIVGKRESFSRRFWVKVVVVSIVWRWEGERG